MQLLVTSAEPGYGKSHLLGRYLRTLDRRASKIYIKPFQNPSLCWQSILLRTIQELNFPDRSDVEFGQPGEPTQLDALAIGIFAHLIAVGLDSGEIGHEKSEWAAGYLRSDPIDAFGFADEANSWADWMRQYFDELLPIFEGQLDRHGLSLTPSTPAWLRVLFRYSFWPRDVTLRRTCLSWLKGESIESDEGESIGPSARAATGQNAGGRRQRPLQNPHPRPLRAFGILPAVRFLLRPDRDLRAQARPGAVLRHGRLRDGAPEHQPDDRRHRQPRPVAEGHRPLPREGRSGLLPQPVSFPRGPEPLPALRPPPSP